ncbi:Dyp-type peroxidase [Kocuria sp. HSID16901]|uniref:Dyp-type peroxidase n=1 Tax=Kocuria sp. HSID16901 TaxID=2419505 RepID=UPI000F870B9D|nr:Dyp-type peroxidase [Kocuria sp. HSID16901]RUQ23329.1 Dyp-type peroxidase [Kocuria sp. HSID16901]
MSSRRSFLLAGGLGLGTAGVGFAAHAAGSDKPTSGDHDAGSPNPAFHGTNQAGIVENPRAASTAVALDLTCTNRSELTDFFKALTDRARALTTTGIFDDQANGVASAPADSGTLGDSSPRDGLAITVGVGSSLFDERFGLEHKKPRRLIPMETFDGDRLKDDLRDGDLSLIISADGRDTVLHALRDILRNTRGAATLRWKQDGFTSTPRPQGTPRNHFGFKDGISNPDTSDADTMNNLVWARDADQPWTAGGSYQVIRLIQMFSEFWDRISLTEQNNIFGRDRSTGAPLDGSKETDEPKYVDDPRGSVVPLTAHMRLANPRTDATAHQRIIRRAFNYENGMNANGDLDLGQVFVCYQSDIAGQFSTIQKRLSEDPLNDYISHIGGGYFLALPGVRDAHDFFARSLMT